MRSASPTAAPALIDIAGPALVRSRPMLSSTPARRSAISAAASSDAPSDCRALRRACVLPPRHLTSSGRLRWFVYACLDSSAPAVCAPPGWPWPLRRCGARPRYPRRLLPRPATCRPRTSRRRSSASTARCRASRTTSSCTRRSTTSTSRSPGRCACSNSGGNPGLTSIAGAKGYFQVMPSTLRLLRGADQVEAGINYLGQLVHSVRPRGLCPGGRNGGPSRVSFWRPMPLESLQYVLGVRPTVPCSRPTRRRCVRTPRNWRSPRCVRGRGRWALSRRLHLPLVQLRLHNPFLAGAIAPRRCSGRLSSRTADRPV